MSDLLLEIYGEELPSSAQILGEKQLYKSFLDLFTHKKISFSSIETFSTSRRISIIINKISRNEKNNTIEIRGPSVEADDRAITGFLKSNDISDVKKLIKKKIKDKEYYFYLKKVRHKKLRDIFNSEIPLILSTIKWKKSMRWAYNDQKWSRPIKSILGIFENKKLVFQFAGIYSNFFTYGNYHYSKKKIKCLDPNTYKKQLKKIYVTLDPKERKKIILKNLEEFCGDNNLKFGFEETIVERISNSVEHANVFFGIFDEKYFKIPEFILEKIITEKQDNFCFKKKNGDLSNFFAFVSNKEKSKKKNLIEGNLNVLKARFADAEFFIKEDLKVKPNERLKSLSSIIYYENLGSLYQRSLRIKKLSEIIAGKLDYNIEKFSQYLIYSNIDLTSEVVKEYPSLQGLAGGFYAKKIGFPKDVQDAFSDQYKISIIRKEVDLSIILSLAQKIDSIFCFFSSKKKISGSGDPFGIRRISISIIKILSENKLDLDLFQIFSCSKKFNLEQKIQSIDNIELITNFLNKRIEVFFVDEGYKAEVIKSCLNSKSFNPYFILTKIKNLTKFLSTEKGKNFMKAFKRLNSISDNKHDYQEVDHSLLKKKEEIMLYEIIKNFKSNKEISHLRIDEDFYEKISYAINDFLDNIKVNAEENTLRINRKLLLSECKNVLSSFYNFSILQIDD
ncbi:MAG: glycine--tRNA ligase subunit beta [Rickettsiales bacterium]|nr:glycine--tRNA ligase subunit beta [Rickettsiales bacterium]